MEFKESTKNKWHAALRVALSCAFILFIYQFSMYLIESYISTSSIEYIKYIPSIICFVMLAYVVGNFRDTMDKIEHENKI